MWLEYHSFSEEYSDYLYNRTYIQFLKDIETVKRKKADNYIFTMDDGHIGQIKACNILKERGHQAILSIATSFIGSEAKYMTWDDVIELSKFHLISNHTVSHTPLVLLPAEEIRKELTDAQNIIEGYTGVKPIYFTPPYNNIGNDPWIRNILVEEYGFTILERRQTMMKDGDL